MHDGRNSDSPLGHCSVAALLAPVSALPWTAMEELNWCAPSGVLARHADKGWRYCAVPQKLLKDKISVGVSEEEILTAFIISAPGALSVAQMSYLKSRHLRHGRKVTSRTGMILDMLPAVQTISPAAYKFRLNRARSWAVALCRQDVNSLFQE